MISILGLFKSTVERGLSYCVVMVAVFFVVIIVVLQSWGKKALIGMRAICNPN